MKHIISLGAGVQSSTLALMAAVGEITPMPDAAIFADTQSEPRSVYEWLEWLEAQLPFPVIKVTKGDLAAGVLEMKVTADGRKYSKINIPFFTVNDDGSNGMIRHRSCTADYKIEPIIRQLREIVGPGELRRWRRTYRPQIQSLTAFRKEAALARKEKRTCQLPFPLEAWNLMQANALIEQWIGISTDEASRMKPAREPWIRNRWPLIESYIARSGCLAWIKAHNYPTPPRSSCVFCPYHNDEEWRRLRDHEPDEFRRAIEFESELQKGKLASDSFKTTPFLHSSRVPLELVDLSTSIEKAGQSGLFDNECEGICGV